MLRADGSAPSLRSVYLFEQGAYAGMFNTGGNNMLETPISKRLTDHRLRILTQRFRTRLRALDVQLSKRNRRRRLPFLRMQPSRWELSVSF